MNDITISVSHLLLILPVVGIIGIILVASKFFRISSVIRPLVILLLNIAIIGTLFVFLFASPTRLHRIQSAVSSSINTHPSITPLQKEKIHLRIDQAVAGAEIQRQQIATYVQQQHEFMQKHLSSTGQAIDSAHIRWSNVSHRTWLSSVLIGFAVFAFLYICYLFLDASTRGQFTWSLRILSALTFICLFITIHLLRGSL